MISLLDILKEADLRVHFTELSDGYRLYAS